MKRIESIDTVVIGAGQSGLSVGYYLAGTGVPFVILEANDRVGDTWRRRWDSLKLFTPARFDGLVGKPFPAPPGSFPTKDAMADYLESYAREFKLPVRTRTSVTRLSKYGDRFLVETKDSTIEANQVVVAMATFQRPAVPDFARDLDHRVLQMHSIDYRNSAQLAPGGVLVVGAGNSGAEIALEAARGGRAVWLSGPEHRRGSLPHRLVRRPQHPVAVSAAGRVPPHPDEGHADGPQARGSVQYGGAAHSDEDQRLVTRRRRARRPGAGT